MFTIYTRYQLDIIFLSAVNVCNRQQKAWQTEQTTIYILLINIKNPVDISMYVCLPVCSSVRLFVCSSVGMKFFQRA